MRTFIVTGGAGFIGSHLVDALIKQGSRVLAVDNLSTGKKENLNPKAKFLKLDVRSPRLAQAFKRVRPNGVFHLAALPRVPLSVQDPVGTSDVNITGTVNVFQAAREAGARRVVFASSSAVYGNQRTLPFKETMTPRPISPYGLQKLAGERFAHLFLELYGFPVVCLRYFNVYGPRIDFESDYSLVLGKFLKQRHDGKPLTIYGDGKQTRGFCYVEDGVRATLSAMVSLRVRGGEVVNIGNPAADSVLRLATLVGGKVRHLAPRPGDVRHTQATIVPAKRLLGWSPAVSLEEGVERTREWFQNNAA